MIATILASSAILVAGDADCSPEPTYTVSEGIAAIKQCSRFFTHANMHLTENRVTRLRLPYVDEQRVCGSFGRHSRDIACVPFEEIEAIHLVKWDDPQ